MKIMQRRKELHSAGRVSQLSVPPTFGRSPIRDEPGGLQVNDSTTALTSEDLHPHGHVARLNTRLYFTHGARLRSLALRLAC